MNFDSETISRLIFLLFIVCISVYLMFVNKNISTEGFEQKEIKKDVLPKDADKLAQIVQDIYKEIWKNDINRNTPSKKALEFYVDYAIQRTLTLDDFKDIIESSAPALERTFADGGSKVISTKEVFGTEDEVTELYNDILFRNPDENELYSFSKMLKHDPTFNLEKLKQILFASEEYKRLEKTQSNAVYSNLMGGVTDRQLTLIVSTTYKNITGKDDLDSDTMKFLKKKLLQFNLNEVIFKQFLEKYLNNEPFDKPTNLSDLDKRELANALDAKNKTNVTKEDMDKMRAQILEEVKQSMQNKPKDQQGVTVNGQEQSQINPNRQVIEILLRTAKENQKEQYLDSQSILDRIKEEARCVFDKNATDEYYKSLGPNSDMSALQDKRNTDDLRNTCIRNKKFLGIDEDMVLDPSLKWSIPQRHPPVCVGGKNSYQPVIEQTALIGTLLENALDTKVGSILPKTPPR